MNFVSKQMEEIYDEISSNVFFTLAVYKKTQKECQSLDIYNTCDKIPPDDELYYACNSRLGCEVESSGKDSDCGLRRKIWPDNSGWMKGMSKSDLRCHFPALVSRDIFHEKFDFIGNEGIPIERMYISFPDSNHMTFPERQLSKNLTNPPNKNSLYNVDDERQCHKISKNNFDWCWDESDYNSTSRPFYKASIDAKWYDFSILYDTSKVEGKPERDDKFNYTKNVFEDFLTNVLIVNDRVTVSLIYKNIYETYNSGESYMFLSSWNIDSFVNFVDNGDKTRGSGPLGKLGSTGMGEEAYEEIFKKQKMSIGDGCFLIYFIKNTFESFHVGNDFREKCVIVSIVFGKEHPQLEDIIKASNSTVEIDNSIPWTEEVMLDVRKRLYLVMSDFTTESPIGKWYWTLPYEDAFDEISMLSCGIVMDWEGMRIILGTDLNYDVMRDNYCPEENDLFHRCVNVENVKIVLASSIISSFSFFLFLLLTILFNPDEFNDSVDFVREKLDEFQKEKDCRGSKWKFGKLIVAFLKGLSFFLPLYSHLELVGRNMYIVYCVFFIWISIHLMFLLGYIPVAFVFLCIVLFFSIVVCCFGTSQIGKVKEESSQIKQKSLENNTEGNGEENRRKKVGREAEIFVDMKIKEGVGGRGVSGDYFVHIKPGEVVAIVGHSGAGKSTLVRVLTGVQSGEKEILIGYSITDRENEKKDFDGTPLFTNGALRFDGFKMRRFSELQEIQNLFGYVPQEDMFPPNLKVGELLKFNSDLFGFEREDLYEMLVELKMEETWSKFPHKCSGGQKRRISFMKEVVKGKCVMLLDEPTSGLDGSSAEKLMVFVKNFARKWRVGVFVIIHQPSAKVLQQFNRMYLMIKSGSEKEVKNLEKVMVVKSKNVSLNDLFVKKNVDYNAAICLEAIPSILLGRGEEKRNLPNTASENDDDDVDDEETGGTGRRVNHISQEAITIEEPAGYSPISENDNGEVNGESYGKAGGNMEGEKQNSAAQYTIENLASEESEGMEERGRKNISADLLDEFLSRNNKKEFSDETKRKFIQYEGRPLDLEHDTDKDWKELVEVFLDLLKSFKESRCCRSIHLLRRLSLEEIRDFAQIKVQIMVAVWCAFLILLIFNSLHPFEGVTESYFESCVEMHCGDLRNYGTNCSSVDIMYHCSIGQHNPTYFLTLIMNLGIGLIGMLAGAYFFLDVEKKYLEEEFRSGVSGICYLFCKYLTRIGRNGFIVLIFSSMIYYGVYFKGGFLLNLVVLLLCFFAVFHLGILLSLMMKNEKASMYGIILVLIANLYSGVFITRRNLNHWTFGNDFNLALHVCFLFRYFSYSYYGFKYIYLGEIGVYSDIFRESMLGTFFDLGYFSGKSNEIESDYVTSDIVLFFLLHYFLFGVVIVIVFCIKFRLILFPVDFCTKIECPSCRGCAKWLRVRHQTADDIMAQINLQEDNGDHLYQKNEIKLSQDGGYAGSILDDDGRNYGAL